MQKFFQFCGQHMGTEAAACVEQLTQHVVVAGGAEPEPEYRRSRVSVSLPIKVDDDREFVFTLGVGGRGPDGEGTRVLSGAHGRGPVLFRAAGAVAQAAQAGKPARRPPRPSPVKPPGPCRSDSTTGASSLLRSWKAKIQCKDRGVLFRVHGRRSVPYRAVEAACDGPRRHGAPSRRRRDLLSLPIRVDDGREIARALRGRGPRAAAFCPPHGRRRRRTLMTPQNARHVIISGNSSSSSQPARAATGVAAGGAAGGAATGGCRRRRPPAMLLSSEVHASSPGKSCEEVAACAGRRRRPRRRERAEPAAAHRRRPARRRYAAARVSAGTVRRDAARARRHQKGAPLPVQRRGHERRREIEQRGAGPEGRGRGARLRRVPPKPGRGGAARTRARWSRGRRAPRVRPQMSQWGFWLGRRGGRLRFRFFRLRGGASSVGARGLDAARAALTRARPRRLRVRPLQGPRHYSRSRGPVSVGASRHRVRWHSSREAVARPWPWRRITDDGSASTSDAINNGCFAHRSDQPRQGQGASLARARGHD